MKSGGALKYNLQGAFVYVLTLESTPAEASSPPWGVYPGRSAARKPAAPADADTSFPNSYWSSARLHGIRSLAVLAFQASKWCQKECPFLLEGGEKEDGFI